MIITIKGADFSTKKIGTLSTWVIFTTLGSGATYSGNRFVNKNSRLSATIAIADGYELGSAGVSVIMGTTDVTSSAATVNGNTITIDIATVTNNVTINAPTLNTGGEEIPNYTFTINPTPSNATVTLTASGYTQNGNSITVPNGTTISWSVSADGYTTRTGPWTINGGNKTENITLTISGGGETPDYTFTINPTPSNATVTLTASGYTQSGNSITVPNGTAVSWSVSADGYTIRTGNWTINGGNKTENITLNISGGGETGEWELYSQDGLATLTTDENGIPTVKASTPSSATVLMMNTNNNFSFKAPAGSTVDGSKMVIIGIYDGNVVAFRPRGEGTGTMLQRYNYTTFNGGALKTAASAVNNFVIGDALKVVWSGNTASLYVNDTLQSSFDCSVYVANETWQKYAGFVYTNFTGSATLYTLSDFTLE